MLTFSLSLRLSWSNSSKMRRLSLSLSPGFLRNDAARFSSKLMWSAMYFSKAGITFSKICAKVSLSSLFLLFSVNLLANSSAMFSISRRSLPSSLRLKTVAILLATPPNKFVRASFNDFCSAFVSGAGGSVEVSGVLVSSACGSAAFSFVSCLAGFSAGAGVVSSMR